MAVAFVCDAVSCAYLSSMVMMVSVAKMGMAATIIIV